MRLVLALLCVSLAPALADTPKAKAKAKPPAKKKAAVDENWWRDFQSGKRLSPELAYVGIHFPTEDCAKKFGSSGKLTASARRTFAVCLGALLDRADDPFKLAGGWIDDLRVASAHEEGRLYATRGPQRNEDASIRNSVIDRVVVFDRAAAKKFVRDNLPDIKPKPAAIAAMKRDGVTSISTTYSFCIDESGQTKNYGPDKHSPYKADWDYELGEALSHWKTPSSTRVPRRPRDRPRRAQRGELGSRTADPRGSQARAMKRSAARRR